MTPLREWWTSRTGWGRAQDGAVLALKGFRWVLRKVFDQLVLLLEAVLGWKETEVPLVGERPRPVVFRPPMVTVVVFWWFFGLVEVASVFSFLHAKPEDEFGRLLYGLMSLTWMWLPVWESSLRLTIRPDGRFVYDTFLFRITFLPAKVGRKGSDWVLSFDRRAVDANGRPSVEFQAKRWRLGLGTVALAVRGEFVGDSIALDSGVWAFDKNGYKREVFLKLEQASREGKQVRLW